MRGRNYLILLAGALFVLLSFQYCSLQSRVRYLNQSETSASVSIADMPDFFFSTDTIAQGEEATGVADTIEVVDFDGRKVMLMSSVRDDASGEMLIADKINPVVVEARFRNIAERGGEIALAFDIYVPAALYNSQWQLRLRPSLTFLGDTLSLDEVFITGEKYRKAQLKGYSQYEAFLSKIIPDSCDFFDWFTHRELLEIFIKRNFKDGDSVGLGVTLDEVIEYYSKHSLIRKNERRKGAKEKMFSKYVKNPILTEGIRLDSVILNSNGGSVKYCYRQNLKARKGLKKINLHMNGALYDAQKMLYSMPQPPPVTYYISSVNGLIQRRVRYLTKVVERNLNLRESAFIEFRKGESHYDSSLGANSREMGHIRESIDLLFSEENYLVDSLLITASSSPEGEYNFNKRLSYKRGESIKGDICNYIELLRDSLERSLLLVDCSLEGDSLERSPGAFYGHKEVEKLSASDIKVVAEAENWSLFKELARCDSLLCKSEEIKGILQIEDLDERERRLSKSALYGYICDKIYPELRVVNFHFYLHRPGMLKDTIHTKILDTAYMNGVNALEEFDYKKALSLLQPYNDINTAVAYISLGYDKSALALLEALETSAVRDYLLAVVHSRFGNERESAEYFLSAVSRQESLKHRGNLDPEIARIIRKYKLDSIYN